MDGKTVSSSGYVLFGANSEMEFQAIGDFDDNGTSDILWRNKSNNKTYIWFMDGRYVNYYGYTTLSAGAAWEIK